MTTPPVRTLHPEVVGYISYKQPSTYRWLAISFTVAVLCWLILGWPVSRAIMDATLESELKITLLSAVFGVTLVATGLASIITKLVPWQKQVETQLRSAPGFSYRNIRLKSWTTATASRQDNRQVRIALARVDDNGNGAGAMHIYQVTEIT